jgi:hypothetical protein
MDLSSLLGPPEGDEPAVPTVRFTSGEQLFRNIDARMGDVDTLLVTSMLKRLLL